MYHLIQSNRPWTRQEWTNTIYDRSSGGRMVWFKHVVVLMAVVAVSKTQNCLSGQLKLVNDSTPLVTLEKAITLQVRPQSTIKRLRLQIVLETAKGVQLYSLGLDATMSKRWGEVEVTMKDIPTSSNVLKVIWPPILLPLAWTTLHLRLRHQQLFQLAVVPHDAIVNPPKTSVPHIVISTPVAASVKLTRTGIMTLRLKLMTANTSMDYTINCGQEYLATSFSSEFGISSSVPLWHSWVWILIGIVAILLVLIAVILVLCYNKLRTQSPKSFTLTHFQSSSHSDGISPVMVSSSQGGRLTVPDGATAAEMGQTPRVTIGIVSSRAPSPGHEVDENTFDYINSAFSHE